MKKFRKIIALLMAFCALGCLLTGIISNALDILGVHAYIKVVISGAIIVGAVVLSNLDNLRKKR